MRFFLPLFASLFLITFSHLGAQVTYVDASATGSQTGATWGDAYTDLQTALTATNQGDIWVAGGTYFPGAPGNRTATFQLKNSVVLYGGFAGNETSLAQRDVHLHVTTLSGDLNQDDTYGTSANWWQFNWSGSGNNSNHIVTGNGTDASAGLDGFRMLAARPDALPYRGGGGLLVVGGSPTIRNCTFQYNAAGFGSSALLIDCNSTFEDCVIKDGYTCNCGFGGWTSGILCQGTSSLTFTRCEFLNHYYVSSQGQGRGAALRLENSCSATITDCLFQGNQTGNFYPIGGGTASGAGLSAAGDVIIDRCKFLDNFAHAGAGAALWGNATVTNSLFARNRAVSHPETLGLEVGNYGAGLLARSYSGNNVSIANCTFVDNNCNKGAGIAITGNSPATVSNCIIYHNYRHPLLPGEDPIFILKQQITGNYDPINCCIEGLFLTEPGEDPAEASNFPGCFDEDPKLVSLTSENFHLRPTSPCINSGDNASVLSSAMLDLDSNPRLMARVDIGCYEFQGTPLPSLVSTNLVEDSQATYRIFNALPFETVYLGLSLTGAASGAGLCFPPPSTLCLDLMGPITLLATLTADADGFSQWGALLPVGSPAIDTWLQAVVVRGPNGVDSHATNTIAETIQPSP